MFRQRRAGLIAAALVAVNPYLVWYSQEARSYSLLVLMTARHAARLGRALGAERAPAVTGRWPRRSRSLTHYFAVFVHRAGGRSGSLWRHARPTPPCSRWRGRRSSGLALAPLALDAAQRRGSPTFIEASATEATRGRPAEEARDRRARRRSSSLIGPIAGCSWRPRLIVRARPPRAGVRRSQLVLPGSRPSARRAAGASAGRRSTTSCRAT